MAELDLTNIAAGSIATPGSGVTAVYADLTSKRLVRKNDAGVLDVLEELTNMSVASQAPAAADVYLTGSSIALQRHPPKVGTLYQCTFDIVKTAAGIAAPVIIVRYGTAGAIGDTARCTFTFPAQTAIADTGMFTVWAGFRTVGSGTTAVLAGRACLIHKGPATGLTGLSVEPGPVVTNVSGGFDSTPNDSFIGISFNGGASFSGTIQLVEASVTGI